MKAKWQDPEYLAKMAERDSRRKELRELSPNFGDGLAGQAAAVVG